jgi:hypothetical protein
MRSHRPDHLGDCRWVGDAVLGEAAATIAGTDVYAFYLIRRGQGNVPGAASRH